MYSNWASRSGCEVPSRVLRLALQAVARRARSSSATSCRLTAWPSACSASANWRTLLDGPAQRRLRIARRGRLHQPLQIPRRVGCSCPACACAHRPGAACVPAPALAPRQLLHAPSHRRVSDPRRARHARDATPPRRLRLRRRPQPPRSLRQRRPQHLVLRAAHLDVHSLQSIVPIQYPALFLLSKRMAPDDKTGPLAPRSTQELAIYLSQFPVSVLEDLSSLD